MKDKRKQHHSSSSASSDPHSSSRLVELRVPPMSTPLQQAVFRGCVECIQVLVETPPYLSVDAACGPEGLRPIHIAAREGHINTLRYLTNAGACILKLDFHGLSALHHAAIGGQVRAVRWLLRHGAEITLDKRGRSPIQVAADNDHLEIVGLLAKHASRSTSNLIVPSSILKSSNSRRSNSGSPSTATTIAAASTRNYQRLATAYGHPPIRDTNHNSNHHKQLTHHTTSHRPKSKHHLICDKTEALIHESSSSGNSSLATLSNSPSLSPSSATTSCASCLSSSESSSAEDKSGVVSSSVEDSGPAPFYLHPPKSSIASKGAGSGAKRNSSFYLHAPTPSSLATDSSIVTSTSASTSTTTICSSVVRFADDDSDIEIQETSTVYDCSDSNNSGSTMAPVTPNGATEFVPPKGEHSNDCFKSDPNSSSPPPTPARNGVSKLPVRFNGQCNGNGNANRNLPATPTNKQKPSGVQRKGMAPPPPPPPPMPKFDEPSPQLSVASTLKNRVRQNSQKPSNEEYSVNGEENDYEDIDDIQADDHRKTMESNKKLNRSVSAPADSSPSGTLKPEHLTDHNNNRSCENGGEPVKNPVHNIAAISAKIYGIDGKPRVPFIPPNFPDPPKDALIKPSEYLKSIQQSKLGLGRTYNTNGVGNGVGSVSSASSPSSSAASSSSSPPTSPSMSPVSKVEECIKMLSANAEPVNKSLSPIMQMLPVTEEANAEDEHEEINPERINGNYNAELKSGDNNESQAKAHNGIGGGKLKFSNLNGGHSSGGSYSSNGIKSDELSKVQLRKTPTTRTVSAPVLGRVLPDKPNDIAQTEGNYNSKPLTNGNVSGTPSTAIIAELTESSQVGGVREWKEELRRRHIQMEKAATKELDQVYSPLNFVAEVPSTDGSGAPIPPWKRQMIAKKVAEKARKEAEEQRRLELEAQRMAAIPPWRRQLLQRRESTTEGKYS